MIVQPGVIYTGTDRGAWTSSATISSTTNAIAGVLSLDGAKDYTGNLDARFYGEAGDQIGGTFLLSSVTGGKASGYLIGIADLAANNAATKLADINKTTLLHGIGAEMAYSYYAETDAYFDNSASATTANYGVELSSGSPTGTVRVTDNSAYANYAIMGSGDVDNAASSAERTVYRSGSVTSGEFSDSLEVDRYIYDGNGGRIALTYSGFVEYVQATGVSQYGGSYRMGYIAYGQATPNTLMPTTGTASYSGVAHGSAAIHDANNQVGIYDVGGTATLAANFGTGAISGQLALNAASISDKPDLSLGTTSFSGRIGDVVAGNQTVGGFSATANGALRGDVHGMFFGPNANEVGGNFDFTAYSVPGMGYGTINGAFVAGGH